MDWKDSERAECERRLEAALPGEDAAPATLHRAMRYAALGPGKRVRPLLCRAAARAVAGRDCEAAWAGALAVECIHAYSLVHDDLPALDNDDLRRGRPTCHKAFGEAMAILAGDALQSLAFALVAGAGAEAVACLARAAGTPEGMVAGQVADMEAEGGRALTGAGPRVTLEEVEFIHRAKTAALIRASVVLGGMAAGAAPEALGRLGEIGEALGLAFQITDDLLDQEATSEQLGKTAGKDAAQGKATYPAVAGSEAARARARALVAGAEAGLSGFGAGGERLRELARWTTSRLR